MKRALQFFMLAVGLMLSGCMASPTPECTQANSVFEEALPSMHSFHLMPGDVVPAIVAGVALAAVEGLPDDARRQRCYDEIMGARFSRYPSYATVR